MIDPHQQGRGAVGCKECKISGVGTRILAQPSVLEQAITARNLTGCLSEIERLGIPKDFSIFVLTLFQFGGEV